MFCKVCKCEISSKRRKSYCSDECSLKGIKEYQKSRGFNYEQLKKWRAAIKETAIEYKGGKCQVCGYNKCNRSMDFHHVDPTKKEFSISSIKNKKIEKLKSELDKCILLCSNCHGEVHEGLINVDNIPLDLGIALVFKEKKVKKCECGSVCTGKKCRACFKKDKRKVERPQHEQLIKEIEELGYCAVGRKYGVSDNAIRKWLIKMPQ